MDFNQLGRQTAALPGRAGSFLRRAPATLAEAAMAAFDPARQFGAGIAEAGQEFVGGIAGLPSQEEMERQVGAAFRAPASLAQAAAAPQIEEPEPDFSDVEGGASGGIAAALKREARAPRFGDVQGGGSSTALGARTLTEAPREEPGSISYNLGNGDGWQDYGEHDRAPLVPGAGRAFDPVDRRVESYRPAAGGGTVSMMTAPENEERVTIASALDDADNASALREARGELSLAQVAAMEHQDRQRYKPEDERRYNQDVAVNDEVQRLNTLRGKLAAEVQAGQRTRESADAIFEDYRKEAILRAQMVRGDSLAAWGPQRNPYEMGAPLPGQTPQG